MNQEIFEKVKEIIVEILRVEPSLIHPDASFTEDLQIDSLGIMDLLMELEDQFGISEIPEDQIEKIRTVGQVVQYIEDMLNTSVD